MSQTRKPTRGSSYTPAERRRIWDAYQQIAQRGPVNWSELGRVLEHHRQPLRRAVEQMIAEGGPPGEETPPVIVVPPVVEPEAEPEPVTFRDDLSSRKAAAELRDLKRRYDAALDELHEAEARFDAAIAVKEPVAPIEIPADPSIETNQAIAIVQASDWHVEERVDPSTVNGLNTYNPDIAQRRAANYFRNVLKLVRKERQSAHIDTLIWHLGGDMISNYLHEELEESNYLAPTEAIRFAKQLILGGLKLWKEDGEFKRIQVVTSYGNHGRMTHKPRFSTGHKNNLEWMMFHDLAFMFEGDEVVKFQIADGYFNYIKAFNKWLRFHHGDAMKYGGGIGGLTIPVLKFIARSNQQQWADADLFGHFHQLMPYSRVHRFAGNGSLIGINAYALRIGASPEEPLQSFHLVDSKYGFTISAPIIVNGVQE